MEWGSEDWKEARDAQLLAWFGGNRHAFDFMMTLSDITELWDDLVDGDKQLTKGRIDDAFFKALVTLPTNPFFEAHKSYLVPLIIMAINSWQDANTLEHGGRNERALAYTLRQMDLQIVQAIVYITQGYDKMREVSGEIWKMFAAEQDDILTWVGETT